MNKSILCIGFSCVDVLVRGYKGVDKSKEVNEVDAITLWVGGDALNEAYVLKKLGNDVKLMTGLGDDKVAEFITSTLDKADVDYSLSVVTKECNSTAAIPVVFEDAERAILTPGPSKSLDFDIDLDKLAGAEIVSLGSIYFPPFDNVNRLLSVVKKAKENNSIVCADMMFSKGCTLDMYKEVWPYIDYFFPNDDEISSLTNKTDPEEMAKILLDYGVKNVVIKIGKKGCFIMNNSTSMIVPAYLVKAKDTTGAGDNFAAGFISALAEGEDLETCCKYANAAASISIQYDGASTGVKSKEQLLQVINNS